MTGGAGNDTFYVDNAGDVVIDRASDAGTDLVFSSVTFDASGTNQDGIENITLTGTGAINAIGNALANVITGNSANNVIDGRMGADTMTGGAGSDTYYVDNAGDVVIDRASDVGTDLVFSSVSFDASGTNQDGIENITLTGTAAINATGNALANVITGNSGKQCPQRRRRHRYPPRRARQRYAHGRHRRGHFCAGPLRYVQRSSRHHYGLFHCRRGSD